MENGIEEKIIPRDREARKKEELINQSKYNPDEKKTREREKASNNNSIFVAFKISTNMTFQILIKTRENIMELRPFF